MLTGGTALRDRPGHFFAATVLADVPAGVGAADRGVFAPGRAVVPFADEEAAVIAANNTEYGLVAYLYTRDLDRALRVADALETGMVGVNQPLISNVGAPFGGVKHSGLGREGGPEGLAEFQELKYVALHRA